MIKVYHNLSSYATQITLFFYLYYFNLNKLHAGISAGVITLFRFFSSTHNLYQINSKCTNRNICSYFSRYKFHSGNQKKNRKVCQNQRCCVTPYIVIYSVLAMNIEISLRYLKHAAGILYFHPKQPESSSCAGIPAGTSVFGFLSLKYRIFGNSWVIEQNFEQPA